MMITSCATIGSSIQEPITMTMARSKGALALLLLSSLLSSSHAAATTLVDSTGSLNKASSLPPTTFKDGSSGVVALLTSPGTTGSLFPPTATVVVDGSILKAPGASLEESTGLARGIGAAAAGTLADAVVLGGVTMGDIESGLAGTRHGRTLAELFSSVLQSKKSGTASTLIIAVEETSGASSSVDADSIQESIEEIFDGVAALVLGVNDEALGGYFNVEVTVVKSSEDVTKVMDQAAKVATTSKSSSSVMGSKPFSTAFSEIYSTLSSSPDYADPTPVAEAILACNDAYSRAFGMSRAKIASWKHRASRGLLVDKFGMNADSLLQRTLDLFDRDTMSAAGLPAAGEQRLVIRQRLQQRMEKTLKDLFDVQMGILEKKTLKKFNHSLLKKLSKDGLDSAQFFEDNATALRTALFAFETSAALLEIPSLSLTKSNAVRDVTGKLNNALMTFPDSPAAKIKAMKKVQQTVSKKKKPSEGSIDLALDVVAMIRPDGFGNLQGFAGYQLGPHSVTVGVHNDADDPQVIAQFGGVRPPFIRVQPKLKLDVEL
ncbi:hypothetical protein ACHAWT_005240 [Skeletonema menzelii]|mmetsp:Transcript_18704/g.30639  ORF Transcript_18704/g.30639 Transcript_18704/m.30639 type:complete len:547 (+) Transcript_18704:2-1642(+)